MPTSEASFKSSLNSAVTKRSINDLNEAELNVFNLLTLLVDIQYRHQMDRSIAYPENRGYIEGMNKILPGQQSPVDDTLEGIGQREIIDE